MKQLFRNSSRPFFTTVHRVALAAFLLAILSPPSRAQTTRFVSPAGSHTPPFTSWATAATDIQSAVDVSVANDAVLVTNGTYQTGGRERPGWVLTNRVVIDKAITVRSVNGPAVTIIKGAQDPLTTNGDAAVRCA